jgi:hypothetical protein
MRIDHGSNGGGSMARRALALSGALLLVGAGAAQGAWRSQEPEEAGETVCIKVEGLSLDYYVLSEDNPIILELRGPRRVKIISRYLFSRDDPDERSYSLRVLLDGDEILRKTHRSHILESPEICRGTKSDIGALRRAYLNIPTGKHELQIFGDAPGDGRVAARVFRETRRKSTRDISFAPEAFDGVYQLQFASGKTSTYYHFSADTPLAFTVTGPTNLKVYTRLDFDKTMNGDQNYSLELLRDGEVQNVYHYHTDKLGSAAYIGREAILPGDRKLMRVPVPKGAHRYELRCLRPETCGIACQIRIPEADVRP